MADWDGMNSTYRTLGKCSLGCTPVCSRRLTYLDHDYEMRQLRIFQNMVERSKPSSSLSPPAEMLYQVSSTVTTGRFITRLRHARPWLKPSWYIKTTMFRIQYTWRLILICGYTFPPLRFRIWFQGRQKSNFWFGQPRHGR
jgi:hypothetical protein